MVGVGPRGGGIEVGSRLREMESDGKEGSRGRERRSAAHTACFGNPCAMLRCKRTEAMTQGQEKTRGRDPLPEAERKSQMVRARVTESQANAIAEAAKRRGETVSAYVLGAVLERLSRER